jgi:hypothetical protein
MAASNALAGAALAVGVAVRSIAHDGARAAAAG